MEMPEILRLRRKLLELQDETQRNAHLQRDQLAAATEVVNY
jgi:hypothetical protein